MLSFMERRTRQLNIEAVTRENLLAAMNKCPDGELQKLLAECIELLDKGAWQNDKRKI